MRKSIMALIAGVCLLMAACATSGQGNLDPLMLALNPQLKVLDFDAKTYQDAAAACNASAANDYNFAMQVCSNPTAFINGVNTAGAGILVPANIAQGAINGLTVLCNTRGFTSSQPMTITQTTCPASGPVGLGAKVFP